MTNIKNNKMSIQVYRIKTFTEGTNSYAISRQERWELSIDSTFDTYEEAEEYILEMSRTCTDLPNFLVNLSEKEKLAFSKEFCFTNDSYIKYRRLFIGKPDISKIRDACEDDGTKFVKI